jgi:dTDP-4-dehydrorhamnose reductase
MRILLTGTAGQVGGALLPLLSAKHTIIAPSVTEFDLSEPESLAGKLEAIGPDLIINPAAYTAVDKAEDEEPLAFLVNAKAPKAMARWAAEQRIPMVHFSTDYVFDGGGSRAWREDDPTGPLSVYGRSKLAGENEVREAGGSHLVIRTAWVYAAQGANFMRTMIRLARERDALRVVADQFGTPTSATTIASTLAQILDQPSEALTEHFARANGLIHLTNSGSTSWHGFASEIVKSLRARGVGLKAETVAPIATADYPTKATRPSNSRLDLARLKDAYGITPLGWEKALQVELGSFLEFERAGH